MFGYGLAGDVEVLRNGVGGHCLHGDQDEDRSSGGVCNGLKNVTSHVGKYEADRLLKYTRNQLASQIFF
jgi:hypothetical protein